MAIDVEAPAPTGEGTNGSYWYPRNSCMQLRMARLCIDCEEIHDSPQCPVCASEAFEYVTRWVPTHERRTQPRPAAPPPSPPATHSKGKLVGFGILGLGIVGLTQWFVKGRKLIEDASIRNAGELK
jgi:hypothetical protein